MMRALIMSVLMMSTLAACVDSHATVAPTLDESALLHRIRFEHTSIIMAVGDTVPMRVVAYDIADDTIPIPANDVTWRSNNDALTIDTLGRLIAHTATVVPVQVIGSWTLNDVERTDTANIQIVTEALDVASVKVTPLDSARKGFSEANTFDLSAYDIRAWDSQGNPIGEITLKGEISGVPRFHLFSGLFDVQDEEGNLLPGAQGLLLAFHVGDAWVKTSALIFGTAYQDSAKFTGLYPKDFMITMSLVPETNAIVHAQTLTVLQPCGTVEFVNDTPSEIRIEFEQPTAGISCGGTLPASGPLTIPPGQSAGRVISVLGDVAWRGRLTATNTDIPRLSGVITVKDVP